MALNKIQIYNSSLITESSINEKIVSNYNLRSAAKGTQGVWSLHRDPFAIDHILEQVLNSLTKSKLLECRLVSHHWNSIITSMLLKNPGQELIIDLSGTKLKELVILLQGRTRTTSAGHILNLAPFPIGAFQFKIPFGNHWKPKAFVNFMQDEVTNNFWTLHGINIRKLSFLFGNNSKTNLKDLPSEEILIKELNKLLTCHAPNMTHLNVEIPIRKKCYSKKPFCRTDLMQKEIQDEIQRNQDTYNNNNNETKSQLKLLTEYGLSTKVYQSIFPVAPDLQEIRTRAADLYTRLFPLKKLHLLKRLCTYPVGANHVKLLEAMSISCGYDGLNRMKLRELHFRSPDYTPGLEEIVASVLGSVNRFLAANVKSLEILCWDRVFFHSGLIWPPSLPNVSVVCFRAPFEWYRRGTRGPSGTLRKKLFFPATFPWQQIFPNVSKIYFYISDKRLKAAAEFINAFNFRPWQSVRNVVVRTNKCVPLKYVEYIGSRVFPAAKISIDSEYKDVSYYITHDEL